MTGRGGSGGEVAERVRVVVLNYHGDDLTLACLDTAVHTEWPADRLEIVLVDNGSAPGFVAAVAERYPSVRVLEPGRNLGFAGGVNLGIRAPGSFDAVALLNNDTTVEPGWLAPLVAALHAAERVGAASAKVLFAERAHAVTLTAEPPAPPDRRDGRRRSVRVDAVRIDGFDAGPSVRFDESFFVTGADGAADGASAPTARRWCDGEGTLFVAAGAWSGADGSSPAVEVDVWTPDDRTVALAPAGGLHRGTPLRAGTAATIVTTAGPAVDVVNNAGSILVTGGFSADRGLYEVDAGQYDAVAEVWAFYGGAAVLSRAFLDDVGLFDERLFLYYEDTDLSWRGRLRGWRYLYVPESVVRHHHAASTGVGTPVFRHQNERNRLLVLLKCAPLRVGARAVAVHGKQLLTAVGSDVAGRLARGRRPRTAEVRAHVRVLAGFVRRAPAMLVARRRLRATVPFSEPMRWSGPR